MPANGETATISTPMTVAASVSTKLLREELERFDARDDEEAFKRPRLLHGELVMKDNKLKLMDPDEACADLNIPAHTLRFTSTVNLAMVGQVEDALLKVKDIVEEEIRDTDYKIAIDYECHSLSLAQSVLIKVTQSEEEVATKEIIVSWANRDEHIGSYLLSILQNLGSS